ncbi:MAG: asparaginase [Gemmatimonadetes bacterium]|nr:asparaginase [Gemmatimonadota bacterium]
MRDRSSPEVETQVPGRVEVTRGGWVESAHRIHLVVADASGRVRASVGDADHPATFRSAAKPLQALPLVEDGVLRHFGLDSRALALACASHNSEPRHAQVARGMLDRIGLDETALACGGHTPLRPEEAVRIAGEGRRPGPLESNCSGKHAGMLALASYHGWSLEGYHRAGHPVQRRMRTEVARWTETSPDALDTAVDGCGVVCFRVPLRAMASAYARFGAAAAAGDAPAAVVSAMTGHPGLVAGRGRLDTAAMRAGGGRLVVKVGAEGVYAVAVPERGLGLALKVEDGAWRAADAALVAALDRLGWPGTAASPGGAPESDPLAPFRTAEVRNTRGEAVGYVAADFELPEMPC